MALAKVFRKVFRNRISSNPAPPIQAAEKPSNAVILSINCLSAARDKQKLDEEDPNCHPEQQRRIPPSPRPPVTKSPPAPANPPTGEAVRLAGRFSSFLGKAPSPADAKKFDGLLKDNPDLGDLLGFALTPGSRWAEKIGSAHCPFAYLESVLEPLREGYERVERKKGENAARAVKDALGDEEEFGPAPKTDDRKWDLSGLEE